MKAKVARKRVRNVASVKKHVRAKKVVPGVAAKKEATEVASEKLFAEPQIIETTVATFQGPVEFVIPEPEPEPEFMEVYEFAVDENEI